MEDTALEAAMKSRIAIAVAFAALATPAAFAAAGDAWYGTNRTTESTTTTLTPSFGPLAPDTITESVTVYYDEPRTTAPVIVEREYVLQPYDTVVVEPVNDDSLVVVQPRTYSRIGRDLFPRRGPSDFGQ
jgi:hypothetical protein